MRKAAGGGAEALTEAARELARLARLHASCDDIVIMLVDLAPYRAAAAASGEEAAQAPLRFPAWPAEYASSAEAAQPLCGASNSEQGSADMPPISSCASACAPTDSCQAGFTDSCRDCSATSIAVVVSSGFSQVAA